jgi:pimeloyl-ACP methyl ester carboxylesterase
MSLAQKFVTSTDGVQIYAEAIGDSRNPTVVFIHGYACASFHFDRQFEDVKLMEKLYLVRYDLRGHGQSDGPLHEEAYQSLRHAQDLKAVLDEFGVKKPILAGWSLGGIVAADAIAAYGSSYISGVIILSSFPHRIMHPEVATPFILNLIPQLLSLDMTIFHRAVKEFAQSCYAPGFKVPYRDLAMSMGNVVQMHPEILKHTVMRTQDPAPLTAASKTLPYLVIQGSQDLHLNCNALHKWMEVNEYNFEFNELSDVGHAPFYENPERTNTLILDFVERLAGRR